MHLRQALTVSVFLFFLSVLSVQAEGLGPGIRVSALWSGGEEKPGGEAALFFQKALLDRAAISFGGGYAIASYGLSSDEESLRLSGPFFFTEGKILLLSFLSVSAGMEWHMAGRGDYFSSGNDSELDSDALRSFYAGGVFGIQIFLDSGYLLEGRYFRSLDNVIDENGFPGDESLSPEHISLGLSVYF